MVAGAVHTGAGLNSTLERTSCSRHGSAHASHKFTRPHSVRVQFAAEHEASDAKASQLRGSGSQSSPTLANLGPAALTPCVVSFTESNSGLSREADRSNARRCNDAEVPCSSDTE
ncbi:MAG: hypothetical protein ACPIOQ_80200, partial [Promethearchaeia archaeon]